MTSYARLQKRAASKKRSLLEIRHSHTTAWSKIAATESAAACKKMAAGRSSFKLRHTACSKNKTSINH